MSFKSSEWIGGVSAYSIVKFNFNIYDLIKINKNLIEITNKKDKKTKFNKKNYKEHKSYKVISPNTFLEDKY